MGWSFRCDPQSKKSLIEERIRTQSNSDGTTWTVLAHSIRGNSLWKVVEVTKPGEESKRYIALDLLGTGGQRGGGWGYKDIDESMGPCETSCPLSYLAMVPDPGGYATGWREKVRAYHARRGQKLELGQQIKLTNGETYKITNLKPLRAIGNHNGMIYRIPRRMLTAPELQS